MTAIARSSLNDLGASYHNIGDLIFANACYKKSLESYIKSSQHHVFIDTNTKSFSVNSRNAKHRLSNLYLHEGALQVANLNLEEGDSNEFGNHNNIESFFIGMKCYLSPSEIDFSDSGNNGKFYSSVFAEEEIALANIFNMSQIFMEVGHFDIAAKLLDISLRLCHSKVMMPSTSCSLSFKIEMMALTNIGYISYKYGKLEKARYYFEAVVKLNNDSIRNARKDEKINSEYVLSKVCHLVSSLMNLARVYDLLGRFGEATAAAYEAGVLGDMLQSVPGEYSFDTAGLILIKADVHFHKKEYGETKKMYQSFTNGEQKNLHPRHEAAVILGMGKILFEERNLDRAMACFLAALKIQQETLREKHSEHAETLYMVGRILHDREEYVDALEMYNRAVKIQRSAHGSSHHATLKTLCNIARVSQICGEHFKALKACTEAVQSGQKVLSESNSFVLKMIILQGTVLHEMGRNDHAVAAFDRAERIIDMAQLKLEDFLVDFKISPIQITILASAAA